MARKSIDELSFLDKAIRVKRQLDRLCPDRNEALRILSIVKDSTVPIEE